MNQRIKGKIDAAKAKNPRGQSWAPADGRIRVALWIDPNIDRRAEVASAIENIYKSEFYQRAVTALLERMKL